MTIDDELAALRKERPKPDTTMADCLVDVIESILLADVSRRSTDLSPPVSVPEAVDAYMAALNAHIDRRVSAYLRTVEVIG